MTHSPEVIVNHDGEGMVAQQIPIHGGESMKQNVPISVKQRFTHSGSRGPVPSYMKYFMCKVSIICRVSRNCSPMAMKGWLCRTERVSFVTGPQISTSFSCPLVFLSTSLPSFPIFASTDLFWMEAVTYFLFLFPGPIGHLTFSTWLS